MNQLKRRTRLLLHMAGQDNTHWPQAMRFDTEERLRQQMELLGSLVQKMLPYNSLVLVKRKDGMTKGICWLNLLLKHVCCVQALT